MLGLLAVLLGALAQEAMAAGSRYHHGVAEERVAAYEPHGTSFSVRRDFQVQDGLGVIYVRDRGRRVARLVSLGLAARMYWDLVPDGVITVGDAWLARARARIGPMLLSSARRLVYEVVARETWFGHDALGSATLESDENQTIGRRAFLPFGDEREAWGDGDRYGFTSQEMDPTGMLHFQHRSLDLATGRWVSSDPLFAGVDAKKLVSLGESSAAYAYVGNGPVNRVDPTGLGFKDWFSCCSGRKSSGTQQQPVSKQAASKQPASKAPPRTYQVLRFENRFIKVFPENNNEVYYESSKGTDGKTEGTWYLLKGVGWGLGRNAGDKNSFLKQESLDGKFQELVGNPPDTSDPYEVGSREELWGIMQAWKVPFWHGRGRDGLIDRGPIPWPE